MQTLEIIKYTIHSNRTKLKKITPNCFLSNFRCFSLSNPTYASKTTHYDSLGVTPKATQADIKAAYYKLSKMYHPDRNKGSEDASEKFRDITEAYEILGNVKARRLYDKGMSMGIRVDRGPPRHDENYYQELREKRTRPPFPGGKQPIYNFDEWSRAHYGATFARDMSEKRKWMAYKERRRDQLESKKLERVVLCFLFGVMACMFLFSNSFEDYDVTTVGDMTFVSPKKKSDDS